MTPEALADLHAQCFTGHPRPWSPSEFAELLDQPNVHLITHERSFAVIRQAGPEAELLTIAVHPDTRRQGLGGTLLARIHVLARSLGAEEMILEVAADNSAARGLYAASGYAQAGLRKNYYAGPRGPRVDAFVLHKDLV